ncbi:hypothetical protein VNO77_18977 [Canavalia gladiata]|uniref:Uncharacterized protein n=1 Tax=Canavalia gladiata TaxID=3824 RepID=A0AAN9LLP6_CANGL
MQGSKAGCGACWGASTTKPREQSELGLATYGLHGKTPSFWHGIFSILIKDYVPLSFDNGIAQIGFIEAFAEEATEILRLFDEPIEMHLHFNQRETKSSVIVVAGRQPLFSQGLAI